MQIRWHGTVILGVILMTAFSGRADTITFFHASQSHVLDASAVNSNTLHSEGYVFQYTMDKLFTGGYGMTVPIGRTSSVVWPAGVSAQAITTGPNLGKARITLTRADGDVFDLTAFSFKLLANTAGAGANLEIMPSLGGEDAFNDPLYFDATGYGGMSFVYSPTPDYWGRYSTALLKGYDKYTLTLYVDFALTGLTLAGAPTPEPASVLLLGAGSLMLLRRRRPV